MRRGRGYGGRVGHADRLRGGLCAAAACVVAGVVIGAFAWDGLPAPGIDPHLNDSSPTAALGVACGGFGSIVLVLVRGWTGAILAGVSLVVGVAIGAAIYM